MKSMLWLATGACLLVCAGAAAAFAQGRAVGGIAGPAGAAAAATRPAEWVTSADGALSLRFSAAESVVQAAPIPVVAELRNNTDKPLAVLRPFGDEYVAKSSGVFLGRVENPVVPVFYSGAKWDYELPREAFVTLPPGGVVTDRLALEPVDFAGSEAAGTYTIRFEYRAVDYARDRAAKLGLQGLWTGLLQSKPVTVEKVPGGLAGTLRKVFERELEIEVAPDERTRGAGPRKVMVLTADATRYVRETGRDPQVLARTDLREGMGVEVDVRVEKGCLVATQVMVLRLAPAGRAAARDPAGLAADIRLLRHLVTAMEADPENRDLRADVQGLAKRLAPQAPGRLVWQALLKTGVLKEGLSVREAEEILGPATRKGDGRIEWYFNTPERGGGQRHVAPYLWARVTNDGLTADWHTGNR